MLRLFSAVRHAEIVGGERNKRCQFSIDWPAFQTALMAEHPAFDWPWWEPWEVQELMCELAAQHNEDGGVQQAFLIASR